MRCRSDALRGTGDALYLPVEKFSRGGCWTQSNWLEVVNTRQRNIAATATLRDSFGSVIEQTTLNLAPLEQQHLNVGLLFGDVTSGYIEIAENKRGALQVQNTTYFHDCSTNSLQSAYLSPGQLPGGQTQISSYNRFLQINNVLSVFNTTPTPLDYQLDLDPAAQLFSQSYTLPVKQLHRYQLNDETIFNTLTESYGPIKSLLKLTASAPQISESAQ